MDKNVLGWAAYRGLRRYLGEWRYKHWKYSKRLWLVQNPEPRDGHVCALCGRQINLLRTLKRNKNHVVGLWDFTLDHIIPVAVILDEGMDVQLLFEHSNLQPAHAICNTKKAHKYTS